MSKLPMALVSGAAVLFASSLGPLAADAHARACASPGSKTLRQTSQVRVYSKRFMTYGCYFRTNRRALLADNSFGLGYAELVEQLRLAGPYSGYNLATLSRFGRRSTVTVVNLRTGRRVRALRRGGGSYSGEPGSEAVTVTDLVLRSNGSVAWIYDIELYVPSAPNIRKVEVRKSDRSSGRATSTLLDSGPTVDPRSLAVRGSTISWKNGGQLRTAALR